MLSARDISTRIDGRLILDQVTFEANPGSVTAIVGPNGSGKTTLLKTMTGDCDHSGVVTLNGVDIAGQPAWALAATRAVLPQSSTLAFPFPVIDVVRIGLHRGTSAQTTTVPQQALARVGLSDYADTPYQMLSGGEQQRVQLARVLAQVWQPMVNDAPRWLMLDEPVSSLDIGHQLEVMEIAKDFALRGGGVVAVMHDLNLTAMYADAVTMMEGGTVLAYGTPTEVFTDTNLTQAYGCSIRVSALPASGAVFVLPHTASAQTAARVAS